MYSEYVKGIVLSLKKVYIEYILDRLVTGAMLT
jgi:hypothetical protein